MSRVTQGLQGLAIAMSPRHRLPALWSVSGLFWSHMDGLHVWGRCS